MPSNTQWTESRTKDPAQLINRLKWKTAIGDMEDMVEIAFDCFKFKFQEPLTKDQQYDFLDFVSKLNLYAEQSIYLIGAYLCQQHIPFKLKFIWDTKKSIKGNLELIGQPRFLRKCIDASINSIMAVNLDEYLAEHPEVTCAAPTKPESDDNND